jgi:hypothetical protein
MPTEPAVGQRRNLSVAPTFEFPPGEKWFQNSQGEQARGITADLCSLEEIGS